MIDEHPPRGAFDYLLDPIRPPPPPPERSGGSGPQRIRVEIEITERRAAKRGSGLGLLWWVLFGLIAWSLLA